MVAETGGICSYEHAVQCHNRRCMHRGMAAPAASQAWINAEPTQGTKSWSVYMPHYEYRTLRNGNLFAVDSERNICLARRS